LNAQNREQDRTEPRYAFSIEPLYLYNAGLKLNLEKQLKPKEWVEVNLTGYYLPYSKIENRYAIFFGDYQDGGYFTINSVFQRFSKLNGGGIGGAYKRYVFKSIVVSANISYTYYDVQFPSWEFYKYEEDGLIFYDYGRREVHQYFNNMKISLLAGMRTSFRRAFFAEYFIGLGYAYSFHDKDKKAYNESPFGFGYRGIYPTIGIKLGFNIK
jgi:hypothetical protein